jgi:hypothetical protein
MNYEFGDFSFWILAFHIHIDLLICKKGNGIQHPEVHFDGGAQLDPP